MRDKAKVVAEIGCNHTGVIDTAMMLIEAAHSAGAYAVKFQKRNNRELLTEEQYNAPHPCPCNSYGDTYGEHREFLEFTQDQHAELKKYCEKVGIVYSCSVWDMTSARDIVELEPQMIKVPSAVNSNIDLIDYIYKNYRGEVHISLGMTTQEERKILEGITQSNLSTRTVYYACTSGYPVEPRECYLNELKRMPPCHEIGYSGHHIGTAIDIAAYTLGATWIERHFTYSKYAKGTDHSCSLVLSELERLIENLDVVREALNYRSGDISEVEVAQRDKLKWVL